MKILIAYDGSDCAKAAIEELRRAGLAAHGEALVLSVAELVVDAGALPVDQLADSPTMSAMARQARALATRTIANAREMAAAGGDLVSARLPGWKVQSGAEADAPYAAIVRKAEDFAADIVVVGSHGHSPLGRLILGSTSQKVLAHAPCSVRVARCHEALTMPVPLEQDPPRLILAVDQSLGAAAAAEAIRMRTWPAGTQVRVVTAVDLKLLSSLVTHGIHPEYDPTADTHLLLRQMLEAVAKELRREGLAADSALLDGDPKQALVNAAQQWRADCIFLGAKGHGRLAKFLLGSVSAAVAARAHCSVEVVRHSYPTQ